MNFINKTIVKFVTLLPKSIVYIFAKKYIAGKTLQEAVNEVKKLNHKNIAATLDVLGESITRKEEAVEAKNECLQVLDAIKENNLNANISIKPTQLALKIDYNLCVQLFTEIVEKAEKLNNFVRIDMEDSECTEVTILLLEKLRERYKNVGIVLQAYMRRTVSDLEHLNPLGTSYRLCKGIYVEPEQVAFKGREEVQQKFLESLEKIFDSGNYVGIATHDEVLINGALKLIKKLNIQNDKFEFQMLFGVRENLRDEVVAKGHKMRIYVPFGVQWYAYSVRRLKENPKLAWYITKSIFS